MKTDLEQVWRGLASPVRRRMLDLLREGPRSTSELTEQAEGLSRFAVMQHLRVLEQSGLVVTRKSGRRRLSFLNPMPIRFLYERWVSDHASTAAEQAMGLKRFVEAPVKGDTMDTVPFRTVKVELEVKLEAPREKVFTAMTTERSSWWPHRFKPGSKVVFEAWVGGRLFEDWGEGQGALYGTVGMYDPENYRICLVGPNCMINGWSATSWESVTSAGSGSNFRYTLTLWGDISEETERMFRDGARGIAERALKVWVEEGKGYQS